MTNREHLIHQHILEYESRLKHIDELIEQAQTDDENNPAKTEKQKQLEQIKLNRKQLVQRLYSMKTMSVENWEQDAIKMAGPMAVWDAVAQQLEKLVEKAS